MVSENIDIWIDKTITAVTGSLVLSSESGREVARFALKELFLFTNNDLAVSLQIIQKIADFSVRRRLLEVFRQSLVESSKGFTSPLFFKPGDFSQKSFADAFDADLLLLWRYSGHNLASFNEAIKNYPNAAKIRIKKRLASKEFKNKRRIRYAVQNAFLENHEKSNMVITFFALVIFLALLIIFFD